MSSRKVEKVYLNGKVIHTYWNPPGLKYVDIPCPRCQASKTIVKTEYWDKSKKKKRIRTICEKCGVQSNRESPNWKNTIIRKMDLEIPRISWHFEDNKWDLRELYTNLNEYSLNQLFLNFENCSSPNLIKLVKLYLLDKIKQGIQPKTIITYLSHLRNFCLFMKEYNLTSFSLIDRNLLNLYFTQQLSHVKRVTIRNYMTSLRDFLEWGNDEKHFQTESFLITSLFDIPKVFLDEPDPLEDSVLEAIRDNLYKLPQPIQLMFILGVWLGTRVGELCLLPKDCLVSVHLNSNNSGIPIITEWWLQFERDKPEDEHRLPLTADLVSVIQEQQDYVTQLWGKDYPYLFCHYRRIEKRHYPEFQTMQPVKRPPIIEANSNPMVTMIRQLIEFCDIRDSNGQLAKFTGAILRPTRASELIQNGYSLEFVRLWLKHRHASTTKRYYARYRPGELLDVATVMANMDNRFYPYESDPSSIQQQLEDLRQNPELHEVDGLLMSNGEPLIGYCLNREFCPKFGASCYLCGYHIASSDKLPLYRDQLARLKVKEQEAVKYWSAERLEHYRSLINALEGKIQALEEMSHE